MGATAPSGETLRGPQTPRRAGIGKTVTPRTLRHAFITAALDAGVPLRDVQEAASHADPRTTMRYDHQSGLAAAWTGMRPTSSPPTSQAPPGNGTPNWRSFAGSGSVRAKLPIQYGRHAQRPQDERTRTADRYRWGRGALDGGMSTEPDVLCSGQQGRGRTFRHWLSSGLGPVTSRSLAGGPRWRTGPGLAWLQSPVSLG